jgi:hypothetical protein
MAVSLKIELRYVHSIGHAIISEFVKFGDFIKASPLKQNSRNFKAKKINPISYDTVLKLRIPG